MSYYLSMSMGETSTNAANNQSNVSWYCYLNSTNGQSYSGYNGMTLDYNVGGSTGNVGVPSAASCAGGATPLMASGTITFNHDANGVLGTVYGSATLNGSGGYAPGSISASSSCGTSDFFRGPSAPSSVVATVNSNKTVTVAISGVTVPGGTPAAGTRTYYSAYSMDGAAYTGLQSSASTSITFTGLLPGHYYTFSGYATNSDGTGGTVYSSPAVFIPAGGKRYDGTVWVLATSAQKFNGTTMTSITTAKRYDGAAWVNLS